MSKSIKFALTVVFVAATAFSLAGCRAGGNNPAQSNFAQGSGTAYSQGSGTVNSPAYDSGGSGARSSYGGGGSGSR